jgi:hypothetical protein
MASVTDDPARHQDAIVGRLFEKFVRILVVSVDRAACAVAVGDEVIRRVDRIQAVGEDESHEATLAKA